MKKGTLVKDPLYPSWGIGVVYHVMGQTASVVFVHWIKNSRKGRHSKHRLERIKDKGVLDQSNTKDKGGDK